MRVRFGGDLRSDVVRAFPGTLSSAAARKIGGPGRVHGCGDGLPSIVRKHFPNALIVADRFHVIRLIDRHLFGGTSILPAPNTKAVVADAPPSPRLQTRAAGQLVEFT